jgi:hypothetical protein
MNSTVQFSSLPGAGRNGYLPQVAGLSYIAFGLVYVLNMVDASVDAHFVRFDVGADLSLQAGPSLRWLTALGVRTVGLSLLESGVTTF